MTRVSRSILRLPPVLLLTLALGLQGLPDGLSAQVKKTGQDGKQKVQESEGKDRKIGQEGGDDGVAGEAGATKALQLGPDGITREVIHNPDGSVLERGLEPHELEELRESGAMGDFEGSHMFAPDAVLRPHRLAPGQKGSIFVILSLAGDIVVLPEARIELSYENRQGPLILGAHSLKPAAPGRLKTQFQGKPVYEDNVIFEIPVTVEAGAEFQKAPFQGKVTLGATQGSSGRALGTFFVKVQGRAHIGPPLPTPIPQRTGLGDRIEAPAAKGPGSVAVPAVAKAQPAEARAGDAQKGPLPGPANGALKGGGEPAGEPDSADGKGPAAVGGLGSEGAEGAGLPQFWLLGGGLILAVLLLLLLIRRR